MSSSLGQTLQRAIAEVRDELREPVGAVAVLAPRRANALLAQQALADAGPYIRVHFLTPDALVTGLGQVGLARQGRRRAPAGWLQATLAVLLPRLDADGRLGPLGRQLVQPGWLEAVANVVRTLDSANVTTDALERHAAASDDPDRYRVLIPVVDAVYEALERDALTLEAPRCRVARDALRAGTDLPVQRIGGAVVLGDGSMTHAVFHVVGAWLGERVGRRIQLQPLEAIEPAPLGLRQAAAHYPGVPAPVDPPLGALRAALFRVCGQPVPTAVRDALTLASVPDEVREVQEAVRVVCQAIADGVPLDRIAIALPDTRTAGLLDETLGRAGVPATWLTGPPLSVLPDARFLLQCLDLLEGRATVSAWYDLLRQPGLTRRGALSGIAVRGKGRWRRFLGRCAGARGTDRILDALDRLAERLDPDEEGAAEDRRSIGDLRRVMRAFADELHGLPAAAPLGGYGPRLIGLLRSYRRAGPDRARVEAMLKGWGDEPFGPPVSRAQLRAILAAALASTQALSGSLKERAIRVAPPMALLGGDFDVVCLLGLSQGRFPRRAQEDPLLPDRFIWQLNAELGRRLIEARELDNAERRRFAAVVSAARHKIWMSVPRGDAAAARPVLASTLVLEVVSACLGRRARYGDLDALLEKVAARTETAPADPGSAVHVEEYARSRVAVDPAAALRELGAHPFARRLLQLHRSIDRLYRPVAEETPGVDAWTGRVDPSHVPTAAAGRLPAKAHVLAQAATAPARYFFQRVLGAWSAGSLSARDPCHPYAVRDRTFEALMALLRAGGREDRETFERLWDAASREGLEESAVAEAVARELGLGNFEALVETHGALAPGPTSEADEWQVDPVVDWHLSGPLPFLGERLAVAYTSRGLKHKGLNPRHHLAFCLQLLALRHRGQNHTSAEQRDVEGKCAKASARRLEGVLEQARTLVVGAQRRARAGFWPLDASAESFRLARERQRLDDALLDSLLDAIDGEGEA